MMEVVGTKKAIFKEKEFSFAYSDLHASWFTHEDESEIRDQLWNIESGDIIFDVGCGFGSYSLPALALGADMVYGWTPLDFEIEILTESLRLNNWFDKCELRQVALYSKVGSINPDTLAFSEDIDEQTFRTTTLDEETRFIIPSGERNWLKLDVEGAEVEVLWGANDFINRFKPIILVENHTFKVVNIENRVRQWLTSQGYKHERTMPHQSVTHSLYLP
jgi:FkbM family methyltransferase